MRRYHHGDLRAAVLARAEETLRDDGIDAVTLRQLARDLCVSHTAPSRHFKDKQALLDALALSGFERLHEALSVAQLPDSDSFVDRFRAFASAYVGFAIANAALLNVMYKVKHDPSASEELTTAGQRISAAAMELIAHGQRTGEVRQGPMEQIGLPVFTTIHGFADLAVTDVVPPTEIDSGLEAVIAYALRGCAP